MANRSKKEKMPIAELDAMFKQFQTVAKREKLTRAKVIKEIKKSRATLSEIPLGDEEGEYTPEFRRGLLKARQDLERGKIVSHETVKRRIARK